MSESSPRNPSDVLRSAGPGSVMASLVRTLGVRGAVRLPDVADDSEGGRSTPAEGDARYHILGELACGGMGRILTARDVDLGREVAMKVLRKELAERGDMVERFIEEAQIGGQLQHPGIVPVYDVGLQQGGRPYFTMKLVKGRTLAALMAERDGAALGRRRFVKIFESVCQTVSYAHARGVVHRDLKPSNIMVGAFGQVHVVDWGLAKVKGEGGIADERQARRKERANTVIETVRSGSSGGNSLIGSVLGTPQYMPPEQARGEVEALDERSDVFSLGAILCEIVTGTPPYTGSDDDLVRKAAECDLKDARKRLRGCGAAPELVAMVDACLAPAPAARPRHAGELADRVHTYLEHAEERARAAKLAAAEARVRTVAAHRSRRLTTALAVSAVGALLIGGGAFYSVTRARAQTSGRARTIVARAMDEAKRLHARAAAGGGMADWSEATLAAERAASLAGPMSGADQATRDDAEGLLTELRELQADAEEAQRRDESARLTAERLAAIRLELWDLDPLALDTRYRAAFRGHDIDLDALSPQDAAAKLRASPVAINLATGLDTWAAARRRVGLPAEPMQTIARLADGDPWRQALRDAEDVAQLRRLAGTADTAALPKESLSTLAAALATAGDSAAAAELGLRILKHHPNDLWTRSQVAIWLVQEEAGRVREALRHSHAAVALGPESSSAWANHAWVLRKGGSISDAERAAREAIRLNARNGLALTQLGRVYVARGDDTAAAGAFRSAIEIEPELADAWVGLGQALTDPAPEEAAAAFERAVALEERSARVRTSYASFLFGRDDMAGAAEHCRAAVRLDPENLQRRYNLGTVLYGVGDLEGAREQYEEATRLSPAQLIPLSWVAWISSELADYERAEAEFGAVIGLQAVRASYRTSLAGVLCRLGRYDEAVTEVRRHALLQGSGVTGTEDANVGAVLLLAGRVAAGGKAQRLLEEAEAALLKAAATAPTAAVRRDRGLARQRLGDFRGAYRQFAEAARMDPGVTPERNRIDARRLRDMDRRTSGVTTGEHVPKSADEAFYCGLYARRRGYFAAAAGYFVSAFEQDPGLMDRPLALRHAINAASPASGGRGEDGAATSDEERARWRRIATAWIGEYLERLRSRFETGPAANARATLDEAFHLQSSARMADIRAAGLVAHLSPRERANLRALWDEVNDLARRARAELVRQRLAQ